MRLSALFILFINLASYGQVQLKFQPTWNKQIFQLGDTLEINQSENIRFDTYRFYLSDLTFYRDSLVVYSDSEKAHLLDLEFDSTLQVSFPELASNSYNIISFRFGIDSTTNVSGAMSGDLDPMHGMYWSWQSGYINCKLEGQIIGTKTTDFQYHLGGYLPPFEASTKLQLASSSSGNINVELNNIFNQLLSDQSGLNIMSPCSQAVELSNTLAHSFYFSK